MKIEIIEHCFGPIVRVDDTPTEDVSTQEKILDELSKVKDKLDASDWSQIANIIVSRSNYEYLPEESSKDDCEQCGNWNFRDVYKKKSDE